jgi:hypothetical protein
VIVGVGEEGAVAERGGVGGGGDGAAVDWCREDRGGGVESATGGGGAARRGREGLATAAGGAGDLWSSGSNIFVSKIRKRPQETRRKGELPLPICF